MLWSATSHNPTALLSQGFLCSLKVLMKLYCTVHFVIYVKTFSIKMLMCSFVDLNNDRLIVLLNFSERIISLICLAFFI